MTAGHEERLWMSIFHRYPPSVLLHSPISASSLPSLVSLWQPLGILGNRLVYSTFHHIGCWIIHPTISRVLKGWGWGGDLEREREWDRERGGQRENEWMDRIYTSCSGKLIIEIWSASHILWLLEERAQCACLAEISGPPIVYYVSAGQFYSELHVHQCSKDPGRKKKTHGPYILCVNFDYNWITHAKRSNVQAW